MQVTEKDDEVSWEKNKISNISETELFNTTIIIRYIF